MNANLRKPIGYSLSTILASGLILIYSSSGITQTITETATSNLIRETVQCAAYFALKLDLDPEFRLRNSNPINKLNPRKIKINRLLERATRLANLVELSEIESIYKSALKELKLKDSKVILPGDYDGFKAKLEGNSERRRICRESVLQPFVRSEIWLAFALKEKGDNLIKKNILEDAERMFERAHLKLMFVFGIDHIKLAPFYDDYAKLSHMRGFDNEAKIFEILARKIREGAREYAIGNVEARQTAIKQYLATLAKLKRSRLQ